MEMMCYSYITPFKGYLKILHWRLPLLINPLKSCLATNCSPTYSFSVIPIPLTLLTENQTLDKVISASTLFDKHVERFLGQGAIPTMCIIRFLMSSISLGVKLLPVI